MRIHILSANPPPFFQNITQSLKVWTVLVQRKKCDYFLATTTRYSIIKTCEQRENGIFLDIQCIWNST